MNKMIIVEQVEEKIYFMRDRKVMIDRDLAQLYGVETKYLNRQVRRNVDRFPHEFMFQLNSQEKRELVTKCHRFQSMKHSTVLPYAFTEHGVAMLASVLKSERAVKISIHIVKTFIRLREYILVHKELGHQLKELEQRIDKHDAKITSIIEAIRTLMTEPKKPKVRIGFHPTGRE